VTAKDYEREAAAMATSDLVLAIVHFEIAKHADATETNAFADSHWSSDDRARAHAAAVELDMRLRPPPRTT
jgi:hypothetical protein